MNLSSPVSKELCGEFEQIPYLQEKYIFWKIFSPISCIFATTRWILDLSSSKWSAWWDLFISSGFCQVFFKSSFKRATKWLTKQLVGDYQKFCWNHQICVFSKSLPILNKYFSEMRKFQPKPLKPRCDIGLKTPNPEGFWITPKIRQVRSNLVSGSEIPRGGVPPWNEITPLGPTPLKDHEIVSLIITYNWTVFGESDNPGSVLLEFTSIISLFSRPIWNPYKKVQTSELAL